MKAIFIAIAREDPPKIHTVTELYKLPREKSSFKLPEEIEEQIFFLNKFYTVTRYPDAANGLPSESVDRLEAERALERRGIRVCDHGHPQ
ncbi:MAG: HEPN domain-containing protein [Candidatus Methanospirareceae archaeon]